MKDKLFMTGMLITMTTLSFYGVLYIAESISKNRISEQVVNPPEPKEDISVIIQAFNPMYEINPREKEGKIFYFVKTENGYDTIQHGQLENFIINDNE